MLRSLTVGLAMAIALSGVGAEDKKDVPEKLQPYLGKWKLVKVDGKEVPPFAYKHVHTITAETWSVQEGNLNPDVFDCKIDTSKTPHTFEKVSQRDRIKNPTRGIIKVEKDTLTFCMADPKMELPKDFKAEAGKAFVVTMVRLKAEEPANAREKPDGPLTLKHTGFIYGVAFSPDGTTLAAGSYAVVKRWEVPLGKAYPDLEGHTQPVETVAYSPNGKFFVSASGFGGQDVKLWDQDGKLSASLKHGAAYAAFSPDSKTVATGASDQKVKLWDTATGKERATLNIDADFVMALAYSPDGKTLAVGNRDKSIRLWDPKAVKQIATLEGHTGFVCKLAYSPDGKILASGSWDGTVKLWDVATQRVVKSLALEQGIVKGVAFSNDGKVLATGSGGGVIKLWDTTTWKELGALPPQSGLMSVAISPDAKMLAAGIGLSPKSGEVKIWNVKDIATKQPPEKQ